MLAETQPHDGCIDFSMWLPCLISTKSEKDLSRPHPKLILKFLTLDLYVCVMIHEMRLSLAGFAPKMICEISRDGLPILDVVVIEDCEVVYVAIPKPVVSRPPNS